MIRRLFIALSFLVCSFVYAAAQEGPTITGDTEDFMHNGSLVRMEWVNFLPKMGGVFVISYLKPRSGLKVAPGTTLVVGSYTVADGVVKGTASTFRFGCKPADYKVTGSWGEDGALYLDGAAPVREQNGCKVIGHAQNANSKLVFDPNF